MRYAFMDNTEMKKSLLALNSEIQSVENSIGIMLDKVKGDIANLYRTIEAQAVKPKTDGAKND